MMVCDCDCDCHKTPSKIIEAFIERHDGWDPKGWPVEDLVQQLREAGHLR